MPFSFWKFSVKDINDELDIQTKLVKAWATSSNIYLLGFSKGRVQKKVIIITFQGGVSLGQLSLSIFFGS